MALGAGNGPGIGGMVSQLFGSTNHYEQDAPKVDPNAYQYGGKPGAAQETANRYRSQAEGAQNRQGVQVDYGQANQDRYMSMQSRRGQAGLAQAMNARAMGQTPSISQMQADRQMGQATAAQASAGASARGAAGIAMAQQNAANNTANSHAAISNQAQINAATERMQAEQAAMGAYSTMRGGDMASQQQSAQQAQYQAGLSDAQRSRNDQMTMGMTQNEMGVQNTQLAGQMNQQAQQSANTLGAGQINAAIASANAQTNQQNGQGVMSMLSNVAGGVAGAFADGGKMKGESPKPYLVGERGPELVIPKQDGHVIPAEETKKLLSPGDVATSTWGVGRGVTPSMAEEDFWKRDRALAEEQINNRRLDADRDARLAQSSGAGGGMAIAGGPGTGTTLDEPLRRMDQETVSLARAKQAEGIELSPEEERKLGGAEYRSGVAKKNDRKPSLADAMKKTSAGNDWQRMAASVDTSYHGPTGGYVPPHLIQIAGTRADGGPMKAGGGIETSTAVVMPSGSRGSLPLEMPMTPLGGGGQSIANPAGHGSALGRLSLVHDMPSMGELNKSSFKQPGPAALMAPGSGMVTHGYGAGSIAGARAEGGPVEGAGEIVPLYSPPGQWLQSTPEGRAYYVDEPKPLEERVDQSRPSLAKVLAPQPKESPIAARAPVNLPPQQPKQRKKTDDELMREAERMMSGMRSEHEQRMAQGPSVSLASRMRAK